MKYIDEIALSGSETTPDLCVPDGPPQWRPAHSLLSPLGRARTGQGSGLVAGLYGDRSHCPWLLLPQLHQSQLELQEVRLSCRQLQVKVEELSEERSLQSSAATSASLLSEIEQSMEAEELEQEREQVPALCPLEHEVVWGPSAQAISLASSGSPYLCLQLTPGLAL